MKEENSIFWEGSWNYSERNHTAWLGLRCELTVWSVSRESRGCSVRVRTRGGAFMFRRSAGGMDWIRSKSLGHANRGSSSSPTEKKGSWNFYTAYGPICHGFHFQLLTVVSLNVLLFFSSPNTWYTWFKHNTWNMTANCHPHLQRRSSQEPASELYEWARAAEVAWTLFGSLGPLWGSLGFACAGWCPLYTPAQNGCDSSQPPLQRG